MAVFPSRIFSLVWLALSASPSAASRLTEFEVEGLLQEVGIFRDKHPVGMEVDAVDGTNIPVGEDSVFGPAALALELFHHIAAKPLAALAHLLHATEETKNPKERETYQESRVSGGENAPILYVSHWARRLTALSAFLVVILALGVWQFAFDGCPLPLNKLLPGCMLWIVPPGLRVIRDLDQLVIMMFYGFGFLNCVYLVVYMLHYDGHVIETIGLLILVPCLYHMGVLVQSYDDRAFTRREEIWRRKREIAEMYTSTLDELAAKLQTAVESNIGQAESQFESKKKDFCRFLEWSLACQSQGKIHAEAEVPFFRFVSHWLQIFQETSLDPMNDPRVGGPPPWLALMEGAEAFPQKMQALKDSVKAESVQFLACEQAVLEEKKVSAKLLQESAESDSLTRKSRGGRIRMNAGPSWIQCGRTRCGWEDMPSRFRKDGGSFPCRIMACCCEMTFVDVGHFTLLLGGVIIPALCVAYIVDGVLDRMHGRQTSHVAMIAGLASTSLCLAVVLWNFDRIGAVMKLEDEISELDDHRQKVIDQRVHIQGFLERAQTLVDFWLHRTLPALDLINEIQMHIKSGLGKGTIDANELLNRASSLLDKVYTSIGSVEQWRFAFKASANAAETPRFKVFAPWVRKQMTAEDFIDLEVKIEGGLPELMPMGASS